ncbi:efflux RND transporter permease subunit [Acanthopleuribacter pedis]|uniref:Efflux RND transporter permease subunit n=1 Tax=Acanthopleuribacter pedis TaxID=442870 RepID=A0A8J7U607_9BACT|nr:efflux RND transporter permease subunit [Acanthopleuribacter pedis]MBO1319851.1 efflux RND transporter permease subunit [Acanthopleuribacter pedis]
MPTNPEPKTLLEKLVWFCLHNPLVVLLLFGVAAVWGVLVAPFDWKLGDLPRDPVPVDAIPDIGENQQIVFTRWPGRSPQDMEDQVGYPLTSALLGLPGVRGVRSYAYFGFSTVYVIFEDDLDFYWSRSRILEKLNSLPAGTLPPNVQPTLGPDATALGQIFWYTLEGRDAQGRPTGGWDLHELRSIQDWYVRYGLSAASGVAEVASVGGYVREYQVDVDPEKLRYHQVSLNEVFQAVQMSNQDVGARNLEINQVEYFIRGLGFVKSLEDLAYAVVKTVDSVPIYVKDVAHVHMGPAQRRGVLDKAGAEAVGGVVVVRFGENPLEVIDNVKRQIDQLAPGLPKKTLADGTVSQVTIVPFYDRSQLIDETLGTLKTALSHEILITVMVILVMLMNLRSSLLVSGLLPIAVLLTFIAMKRFGVDANIVALSGIAIAIGTMVDMGIVMVENIVERLERAPDQPVAEVIFEATREVGGAVTTAVATTVISFLPIFTMEAAEGKLFRPLAFTKTFALLASILVSLTLIPTVARVLFRRKTAAPTIRWVRVVVTLVFGVFAFGHGERMIGVLVVIAALLDAVQPYLAAPHRPWAGRGINFVAVSAVAVLLTDEWLPLGPAVGFATNFGFVTLMIGTILGGFLGVQHLYPRLLGLALRFRALFLVVPACFTLWGLLIWVGLKPLLLPLPGAWRDAAWVQAGERWFPGLGKEFMPPLDEGSFLFMPTTSVHASIGEARDQLQKQNIAFDMIPEVALAVGKLGRAETPLDPAPVSMIETVINYHPEYLTDTSGERQTFAFDAGETDWFRDQAGQKVPAGDGLPYQVKGRYHRDEQGRLVPDPGGMPFRMWRPALDPDLNPGRAAWPGIHSSDDIWAEIVHHGRVPGATSAPNLQPIEARLVMLQSGMRAPMGIKIKGPDLATIEAFGLELERLLPKVEGVSPHTVIADRIIGKPYLEFHLDRRAMARYGVRLAEVQQVIEVAIGGRQITTTVEGRERYPVRVRYQRELRDSLHKLERVLVPTPSGAHIPLSQLSDLRYERGPQVIKSEDTFLVSYVIFDKQKGHAEVDVVERVQAALDAEIAAGRLVVPAGVKMEFAGNYQNQQRASARLALVLPLALIIIFLLLYLNFRSVFISLLIFSAIAVACAGGFILIWLYAQPWFFNMNLVGVNLRDMLDIGPMNLSVAVWVGFLALFGIASDDGVLMSTYLVQTFRERKPGNVQAVRAAVVHAATRRIRPALMTTATTIIALIPVMTSTGRGADIMKPMAIPTFGGMLIAVVTVFVVPVCFCMWQEGLLSETEAPTGSADEPAADQVQ